MYLQNIATQTHWNSLPDGGVTPDFISSSAKRLDLSWPVEVQETVQSCSGDVVLACVDEVNPAYPNLELTNGTERPLNRGNLIIGAFGHPQGSPWLLWTSSDQPEAGTGDFPTE